MTKKNSAGLYETEIDGKKYEFEKWGADDQLDVLLDVAKILGKPLGAAFGSMVGVEGKVDLDKNIEPTTIQYVFDALVERFDKETIRDLIKKLSTFGVFCEGAKIVSYNVHYKESLLHSFKVAQAALEVQYGNFFDVLSGIVGRAPRPITNRAPQA